MTCRSNVKMLPPAFVTLFAVFASFQANALLISQDDVVFGNDSITLDTETGIEWLDLSVTQGKSYNETLNWFAGSTADSFKGWRLAVSTEIEEFWGNAGLVEPFIGWSVENDGKVAPLIGLWGKTRESLTGNKYIGSRGYYWHKPGELQMTQLLVQEQQVSFLPTHDYADLFEGLHSYDNANPDVGIVLVRNVLSVPEPSSVLLVMIGISVVSIRCTSARRNSKKGHSG